MAFQLTRGQQIRLDDGNFDLLPTDADELIDGEEDGRSEEEVVEEGRLDESSGAVQDHEDEEDDVAVVGEPESAKGMTPGELDAEHVDDEHLNRHRDAGKAYERADEIHKFSLHWLPITNVWLYIQTILQSTSVYTDATILQTCRLSCYVQVRQYMH